MRSLIAAALIALPALAGAASADEARMTRAEFQQATQCLAYTNLAALQDDRPDTSALDARVANELALRPTNTRNEVREATRAIRLADTGTPARIERLKAERARACDRFLTDTVQAKN